MTAMSPDEVAEEGINALGRKNALHTGAKISLWLLRLNPVHYKCNPE